MRRVLAIVVLVTLVGAVALISAVVVIITKSRQEVGELPSAPVVNKPVVRNTSPDVEKLCGTCHKLPPPDCMPRVLWPDKIKLMYEYAETRGLRVGALIRMEDAIQHFVARAPEHLALPKEAIGSPSSPLAFQKHMIALECIPGPPAVSCVKFVRLSDDGPVQLLISDMRHGVIALWTPSRPTEPARVLARVPHPSHVTVVDLDRDSVQDVLVANLGVFWNVDTDQGSVVWLRGLGNGEFESTVLLDRVSRVNEVRAADFDCDGDLDIVVAVFGNFTTGMIVYMENFTEDYSEPDFEPCAIDSRAGTSDIPALDVNLDGHLDFIALQSQEHDRVVAFMNNGHGRFVTSKEIYAAPHPRWGSTGIELVDMDHDGDMDVLLNNGDMLEVPPLLRPYHGFGWLENQGTFPFTYHRLAHMPGAHTAQPADLDGDGDLDIVSSAFIPGCDPNLPNARLLDTAIWLEQTEPGQYNRYAIENRTPFHPRLDLGDYDDDGDIDIVLANFIIHPDERNPWRACITLLENELVPHDHAE